MNQDQLMDEHLLLALDALAVVVAESGEPEVIRVALAALTHIPGGVEQLKLKGLGV